jgi:hypothetical protein
MVVNHNNLATGSSKDGCGSPHLIPSTGIYNNNSTCLGYDKFRNRTDQILWLEKLEIGWTRAIEPNLHTASHFLKKECQGNA